MENNYELIGEDKHRSPIYFVPDIEDIRVGYECEMYTHRFLEGYGWNKQILGSTLVAAIVTHSNELEKGIKTPYLTKEQIEAEGWKPVNTGGLENGCMNGRCAFTKGNYFLIIPSQPNTKLGNRIEIVMVDVLKDDYNEWTSNGRMYLGECRCINDFRLIMKLLCIK